MDQVIHLALEDDILKLHSQVEWSDGRRVILVVPRGCKALDAEHELRLLRRWADSADVMVSLVTTDLGVREIASAVGLPFFSTVGQAQRAKWKWQRDGVSANARMRARDDDEKPFKEPFLDRLGLAGIQLAVTLTLFLAVTLLLGAAAVVFVPSARITLVPASAYVTDAREIYLDPAVTTIDQVNAIIPAALIRREISGTASVATSKQATAPADHATGTVVFSNLSGTPVTVTLGTVVMTSAGVTVRFSTTVTSTLPGDFNARAEVPVRALVAGPIGNVKAFQINTIEGPLAGLTRAINPAPTNGGTIKQVHIVSFEDKSRLREKLGEQLRLAAVQKLQAGAGKDAHVPPVSVQVTVLNETFDRLVDDPAESLSLHIEAVVVGTMVDLADLKTYAERNLIEKIPSGYVVMPNTLRVEVDPNARVEGATIIMKSRAALYATPQVQSGELLKGVTWQTPDEAARLIAQRVKLAKPPEITITPEWFPRLPYFGFRLALFVEPERKTP